ncbi:MAG: hypothetical protein Q8L87_00650, partial [Anaerolineales bacterium]|nr:hypothetical protein [Anaerolineales bacterium]
TSRLAKNIVANFSFIELKNYFSGQSSFQVTIKARYLPISNAHVAGGFRSEEGAGDISASAILAFNICQTGAGDTVPAIWRLYHFYPGPLWVHGFLS